MINRVENDLKELIDNKVIDQSTAQKISDYYTKTKKPRSPSNLIFVIFAVIGAFFIGLGVILLVAHNWDTLSNSGKAAVGFLPLMIIQIIVAYIIYSKYEKDSWRESGTVLLILLLGACLAIIDQTYNSADSLNAYMLRWSLLSLPMIYIMRASVGSVLYIILISILGISSYFERDIYTFWGLLAGVIPFYVFLLIYKSNSLLTHFHGILLPISITMMLGLFIDKNPTMIFLAYITLFTVFYLLGGMSLLHRINGYKTIGGLGIMGLMLLCTYDFTWDEILEYKDLSLNHTEFAIAALLTVSALILLIFKIIRNWKDYDPVAYCFIVFIILLFPLNHINMAYEISNLAVLAISILIIVQGTLKNRLIYMNLGLISLALLITFRFFDLDLSYLIRGFFFICLGIAFFLINIFMTIRMRKADKAAAQMQEAHT